MASPSRSAGSVVCFGKTEFGVANAPIRNLSAVPIGSVACGAYTTCTVTAAGVASCVGSSGDQDPPFHAIAPGPYLPSVAAVFGGSTYCFVVASSRSLHCRGLDPPRLLPVVAVSTYATYGCAILAADGSLTCFGQNTVGEAVAPSGAAFKMVSTGFRVACGVLYDDDSLLCWGSNDQGQGPREYAHTVLALACSAFSATCLIRLRDGSLDCFGAADSGLTSPPATGTYKALTVGVGGQACAVRVDGRITCWGVYARMNALPPLEGGFTAVSCGQRHCCGLAAARVKCWGENDRGQLGGFVGAVPRCAAGAAGPSCEACALGSTALLGASQCSACVPGTHGIRDAAGVARCQGCAAGTWSTGAGTTTSCVACSAGQFGTGAGPCTPCAPTTFSASSRASACARCPPGTTSVEGATACAACGAGGGCGRWAVQDVPVAASDGFACWLVAATGGVACAGNNGQKQASVPPNVIAQARFVSVCAGTSTACGLRADGSVVCWGTRSNDIPNRVPAVAFVSLFCGQYHVCGLREGGFVRCWGSMGSNEQWMADDGVRYVSLSLAASVSCGLRLDGSIACGGYDGGRVVSKCPTTAGFVGFDVGNSGGCAFVSGGALTCWGDGAYAVPPTRVRVTSVSVGEVHACGIAVGSSRLVCWGQCEGLGPRNNRCFFAGGVPLSFVSVGKYETCAVTSAGALRCSSYQFALPTYATRAPAAWPVDAACVSAGTMFTCVVSSSAGDVWCAGNGGFGDYTTPIPNPGAAYVALASGATHTCGLLGDAASSVACFGSNEPQARPPAGLAPGSLAIMAGGGTTCVLRGDRTLVCWGRDLGANRLSEATWTQIALGFQHGTALATDGNITVFAASGTAASILVAPPGAFAAVAASWHTSCALQASGAAVCFGEGSDGEKVVPGGLLFRSIAGHATSFHYCGVLAGQAGGVACWGNNLWGQRTVPQAAASGSWALVVVGGWHSCALASIRGSLLCWGRNDAGQVLPLPLAPPMPCAPGGAGRATGGGCFVCPAGTFALPFWSDCMPCAAGSYGPTAGATSCMPCPAGTFGNATGGASRASACLRCAPGAYSASGATACAVCPALTLSSDWGASDCAACPVGTTSTAGAFACTACTGDGGACVVGSGARGGSVAAGYSDNICWLTPGGAPECKGPSGYGDALSDPRDVRLVQLCVGGQYVCGIAAGARSIVCFGSRRPPPPGGGAFASVSCGSAYTCGVRLDGSSACW